MPSNHVANRREFVATLGAALSSLALPSLANVLPRAGDFPSQPIRLVSPFPPGGGNDFHLRLVSNELAQVTGQQAVADNRGGAGGNIGTKYVADAKADGYTVLLSQVSIMAVNPTLYKAPGFDAVRSFLPITQVNAAPIAVVVPAASPIKSIADLRAVSRSHAVTYASPGNGTLSHLLGVVLEKDAGINLTHVPYRGAGPALADVLGGQVQVLITSTSSVAGYINQGSLRALAVSSPRRVGVFKSVPTLEEQGFKDMTYDDWYGFFAPAGTSLDRVAYLHRAITTVLSSPTVSQKILDAGGEPVAGTPEQLADQLRQDVARWSRIAKLSGAALD
ncbi:Tripartite-type tricarboxylate transporter, receptor component TctC [Variovorax sp. HW608]|uniref:Bug family tripartite tricarboxylate transporter substrate binding protein n=1 Tax=Variovorax sp. HW608 TaxID=1034889 RepID=UPI00081F8B2B|nr:tripartite tricarboxylate transporter substrate binding protein [Variovorax sp. HW608]SCK25979.1 Tripartite-type tricarboxylate transporter, receptor component TctC [Variovorax sp. HW608]